MLIPVLCVLGCVHYSKYTPNPEKDIEKWIANFSQQYSFSYRYTMHTATVNTEAHGECVIGYGEHIKGTWEQGNVILPFEYIGLRDREYNKESGTWQSTARGEQSDILMQIERLLQFDKFGYMGMENNYWYKFKANIPFLAPGRWKEMIGIMEISARNYLPVMIWAGLPDSSVSWSIELSKYNIKKSIGVPKVPWHDFQVITHDVDITRTIKERLGGMDIDHRVERSAEKTIVSVPEYYSLQDIQEIMLNSTITIYDMTDQKENARMIGYLRNDKKSPLYLTDTLFTEKDIKSMKIEFDNATRPFLLCSLKRKAVLPAKIAIAVNGTIQHVAALDTKKKISKLPVYTNMQYKEMQFVRISVAYPMPQVELKIYSGDPR